MNRRNLFKSLGAGLATLAASTRLATASVKPAADFIAIQPEPYSIGGNGEMRWRLSDKTAAMRALVDSAAAGQFPTLEISKREA